MPNKTNYVFKWNKEAKTLKIGETSEKNSHFIFLYYYVSHNKITQCLPLNDPISLFQTLYEVSTVITQKMCVFILNRLCIHEQQMFPCRNNFCNKYVKSVISDLYKITKCEIQKTKNKTYLLVYIAIDSKYSFGNDFFTLCFAFANFYWIKY